MPDYFKEIYKFIGSKAKKRSIAGDEYVVQMNSSDIEELSKKSFDFVRSKYIDKYGAVQTPEEAKSEVAFKIKGMLLGDSFDLQPGQVMPNTGVTNPINRIGTFFDPAVYTHSNIPIMFGPYDSSATYGQGGLPAQIIDKKTRGIVEKGATFKPLDKFWSTDKIDLLETACYTTGFNDKVSDAICDSAIYGGSILYPVFDNDSPSRFRANLYSCHLKKGCVKRWVAIDRWNVVAVPSYIITAKDYLQPDTLYIPQAGITLSTSRVAMIRPKPMPYWVALYNLGWSPSDFAGWIRAYMGYEILCQSIPIMAQQMSLLLYRIPVDGLNATVGPERVRKLMQINEEKMREWSALSPKAVNMIGEVEVVERTYTGFDSFVGTAKSNLASTCGVPEPVLWHTPNKGFSDNTTESLLKQSESMQMSQGFLERSMRPCTDALIAHVFGSDSEEFKNRGTLRMTFNKPLVSTEKDLAEVGARFAASVASLTTAGIPADIATKFSAQFFPSVKLDDEMIKEIHDNFEPQNAGVNSVGVAKINTGKFTKPQKASVKSLK